jgi:putative ABC transport system permease protein
LAGVGIAGSLMFIFLGFIIGLCNGFSVVLAQRFGAKSKVGVRRCVTTSIYLGLFFSIVIMTFIFIFSHSLLSLINTPPEVMDFALTYFLILSSGVSLIVTYNLFSGILRAIGARKKDISRVFNAETFIVGLAAGIIGIGATLLLNIVINIILFSLTGLATLKATLPVAGAIILVAISVGLTLIAGLIPSRVAAKKDPVIALRTE